MTMGKLNDDAVDLVARAILATDTSHIGGFWYPPYHVIRDHKEEARLKETVVLHKTIFPAEHEEQYELAKARVIARAVITSLKDNNYG
jgi:hypothetical protein